MIYTSYYGKLKSLDLDKFILLQISNSAPKISGIKKFDLLIPDWKTIVEPHKNNLISNEEYVYLYHSQVNKLDKNGGWKYVANILIKLQDSIDKDILLLCYENPYSFCHRLFAATYLNLYLPEKYKIKEYSK